MATQFASTVYICKGVPLDKDYNHTLYFADANSQLTTFYGYRKYELFQYSYQRELKNVIKVQLNNDDLYDCNYLVFQNGSHSNKWFYCFIDSTEYISDNCAAIHYTVDAMQTWYFDYETGMCMVEREHTITDNFGENLVDEDINCGDYVEREGRLYGDSKLTNDWMLGCLVLNKPIVNVVGNPILTPYLFIGIAYSTEMANYDTGGTGIFGNGKIHVKCDYCPQQPKNTENRQISSTDYSGICTPLYIYNGIYISIEDANVYDYDTMCNSVDLFDPYMYYDQEIPQRKEIGVTLQTLLNGIANGKISGLSAENIVATFQYPSTLSVRSYLTNGKNYNPPDYSPAYVTTNAGFAMTDERRIFLPKTFSTYTPKNKKLLQYPYQYLKVSNNNGEEKTYNYEDFTLYDNGTDKYCKFKICGSITADGNETLFPLNYKSVEENFNEGVTLKGMPEVMYNDTAWARYKQQNMLSDVLSVATGAISAAISLTAAMNVGLVASTATGQAVAEGTALHAAGREFTNHSNVVQKIAQIKRQPPKTHGNISLNNLNAPLKRIGFNSFHVQIKPSIAKIIDDYFSMYGYKVMELKELNIRTRGFLNRPHWNYVKTANCIIHAANGKGLPQDAENKISTIYNNGITFWMNASEVGNYSLDNSPTV